MKILPIRKSTKKKEAQVADLEILAKIIPIVAGNPCQNNPNCCHLCFPYKKGIHAK